MKQRVMKISVISMAAVVVAMVVLGIRQVFFHIDSDFDSAVVTGVLVALLGIFVAVQLVCLFLQPFTLKKIGFFALHIGLVAMLIGFLLYFLVGIKVAEGYAVTEYGSSDRLFSTVMKANHIKGEAYTADLESFGVGITKATVEYYDPVYDVFGADKERLMSDVEPVSGVYDFGEYGQLSQAATLKEGQPQAVELSDGIYAAPRVTPKHYQADVVVYNAETDTNSEEVLTVNHPLRVNGWKVYLMSCEENYVQLVFKKDPGEAIVIIGMCLTMIGAVIACFKRKEVADA